MVSGPELSRLLKQFEGEYLTDDDPENPNNFKHHEQGLSTQKTFQMQVNSLSKTIMKMGNPFLDDFPELVTIDSRTCMQESVIAALHNVEDIGKRQYQEYVMNVLKDHTCSIHKPIKKNSLSLIKSPKTKATSKQGKKIKELRDNVELFGQLYISMQNRDGDLDELFSHEIQSYPPSLSDFGKLHLPTAKSQLLQCFEQKLQLDAPVTYDCKIMDGAVIVQCLPTAGVSTFEDYADRVFIPYLEQQLQSTSRLDIVWDTYRPDSLKLCTREKRGKGVRRKVSSQTKLPGNWMDFLRVEENKTELFAYLTSKVADVTFHQSKAIYITSGEHVLLTGSNIPMPNCNHKEADTRIVVHIMHVLEQGNKVIQVRTVDTDVVTTLVDSFSELVATQPMVNIWVAFGMGKHYRFYSINAIYSSLGEQRSRALPVFHSFTGCDVTSSFKGKGKLSAWQAWEAYQEVTETLVYLASNTFEHLDLDTVHFKHLERLTVILYDRTSPLRSVNKLRKELFCLKNRCIDRLPPTQDALLQHSRRAIYQAGIWTTSTQRQQALPSPEKYGWVMTSGSWTPIWLTMPEASKACRELVKCSCKGECSNCKCEKSNLSCSPLCRCTCND